MDFLKFHMRNGGWVWLALFLATLIGTAAGLVDPAWPGNLAVLAVGVLMAVLNRDAWKRTRRDGP